MLCCSTQKKHLRLLVEVIPVHRPITIEYLQALLVAIPLPLSVKVSCFAAAPAGSKSDKIAHDVYSKLIAVADKALPAFTSAGDSRYCSIVLNVIVTCPESRNSDPVELLYRPSL